MEPGEPSRQPRPRAAASFAILAFFYSLAVTLVLLVVTGFFDDDPDRNKVMLWMCLPILAAFVSWMAVQTGKQVMRLVVWLMVLAALFFTWLAVFSIGPFYVPVVGLLILAVLSPWENESNGES